MTDSAYDITNKQFGYNGLGDKSDGFRHGIWNALLTRDITRSWAEAYTTAHESGKSAKQLEKKAKDGYKEKYHRNMDLHNNAIGRDVVKWYDTGLNVSDTELVKRNLQIKNQIFIGYINKGEKYANKKSSYIFTNYSYFYLWLY